MSGLANAGGDIVLLIAHTLKSIWPAASPQRDADTGRDILGMGWITLTHLNQRFRTILLDDDTLWKDIGMAFLKFDAVKCITGRLTRLSADISYDQHLRTAACISSAIPDLDAITSPDNGVLLQAGTITSTFLSGTGVVLPFQPEDSNVPLNGCNWRRAFEGQTFPNLAILTTVICSKTPLPVPSFIAPSLRAINLSGIYTTDESTEGCSYRSSWDHPGTMDGASFLRMLRGLPSLRELRLQDIALFTAQQPQFGVDGLIGHIRSLYVHTSHSKTVRLLLESLDPSRLKDLTAVTRIGSQDVIPAWAWSGSSLTSLDNLDLVVESSRDLSWVTLCKPRRGAYSPYEYCGTEDTLDISRHRAGRPNIIIGRKRLTRLYCHGPTSVFEAINGPPQTILTSPFPLDLDAMHNKIYKVVILGLYALSRTAGWHLLPEGDDYRFISRLPWAGEYHLLDERAAARCFQFFDKSLDNLVIISLSPWYGRSAISELASILRSGGMVAPKRVELRGSVRMADGSDVTEIDDMVGRRLVDKRTQYMSDEADEVQELKHAEVRLSFIFIGKKYSS
ncbi:unnamed protein product [Peniophora sp. CBMAI 1063]|nr:unnamed protein product [Peniophora sp. CBMAI 1063]